MAVVPSESVWSGNANAFATDGIESVAFAASKASGFVVVGVMLSSVSRAISSIVDDGGNTYTLLTDGSTNATEDNGSVSMEIFIYGAPITSSMQTVTVTIDSALATPARVALLHVTGQHATTPIEDVALADSGATGQTSHACGPVVTAAAGNILFGCIAGSNGTYQNQTGWTSIGTTTNFHAAYDDVGAASTSWTPTTPGSELSCQVLIAIQPAAAGGTDYDLACDSGSFAISGTAASVLAARRLTCDAGSFAVTGTAASVLTERLLSCDSGSVSVTGTAATLRAIRRLACDQGSYTVSGTAAALQSTRTLTCSGGTFSITGTAAELKYGNILTAESGAVAITGTAAALQAARMLTCSAGAFAITGTDAVLTSSGATGPAVTSDYRVLIPEDDFIVQMPSDDLRVLMPSDDTIGVM